MKKNFNKMCDAMFMPLIKEAINKQKKSTITIVMTNPDGCKCALCMCFAFDTNTEKYAFLTDFFGVTKKVEDWVKAKCKEILKMFFDNKVEPFKYTDANELVLWMESEIKHSIVGDVDMSLDLTK